MNNPVIACQGLSKSYDDANVAVDVLTNVTFSVAEGELIAIAGSSGSGKSTLLHQLGGLDRPSAGTVRIMGEDPSKLSESARSRLRNRCLGFVYQFHHLLPEFTALENVAMPLLIRGDSAKQSAARAESLLASVGLSDRSTHRPGELSGGERQRVAIARALVNQPACILADEPTGNLDPRNAARVLELFVDLQKKYGTAVVLVTHDMNIARRADRMFVLEQGCLVAEKNPVC